MGAEMALGACLDFGRQITAWRLLCVAAVVPYNATRSSLNKRTLVRAFFFFFSLHALKHWNSLAFPLNPSLISIFLFYQHHFGCIFLSAVL